MKRILLRYSVMSSMFLTDVGISDVMKLELSTVQ
jgi:hypothetical protein